MEKKRSRSDSSARFRHGFFVRTQSAHGLANFVFRHADDVIDISADMFEIDCSDALGAKTIGQRLRNLLGWKGHDVPGAQAGSRIGGKFGFDPNYLDPGVARLRWTELDGSRDAADESTTSHGDEHGFNMWQ